MASIESIDMVRFKEEMKNVFFFFWALLKVSALKKKKTPKTRTNNTLPPEKVNPCC